MASTTEQSQLIKVVVSSNQAAAWLMGGPLPGLGLTQIRTLVAKAIKRAGVCHGLLGTEIHQAINMLGAGQMLDRHPIAQATPPQPGVDGKTQSLVKVTARLIGRQRADGHIDFRDRGQLPTVQEGVPLAKLIPPVPGKPGMTVTGQTIAPPKPKPGRLVAGMNTKKDSDGVLYSVKSGHLVEVAPGKFSVMDYLNLPNVDYETGHVKHPGLVRVAGAIIPNFKVDCAALVAETIEANAEVKARESVVAVMGIMGGRINCGGRVQAKLARKAEIIADDDVIIESELVDCRVQAAGRVIVTSPQGRIVNCHIAAGRGVRANDIISMGKHSTRITLGPTDDRPKPSGERQPGKSRLRVTGRADRKLVIDGYSGSLTLDKPLNAFTAKEDRRTDPNTGRIRWMIVISE